jgi:hypothetical protein
VNVANRSLSARPEGFQNAELDLTEFWPGHLFYYSVVAYYDFVGEDARDIFEAEQGRGANATGAKQFVSNP